MIVVNSVGENPGGCKAGTGVERRGLSDEIEIVTEASIERQIIAHAPFILPEEGIFLEIGVCGRTRCASSSKGLRKGVGCIRTGKTSCTAAVLVASESFQAIEYIRPREVFRKEDGDFFPHRIFT